MSIDAEAIQLPESAIQPAIDIAPPRPKPLPVTAGERVASVDVLRGVALLGILAINIVVVLYIAWVRWDEIAASRGRTPSISSG